MRQGLDEEFVTPKIPTRQPKQSSITLREVVNPLKLRFLSTKNLLTLTPEMDA
jgi:hypothetical protein